MNAGQLVENYLSIFATPRRRDIAGLERLLAPALRVKSPLGEYSSAEAFLEDIANDRLMIESIQVERLIADDERVSVLYRLRSRDPDIGEILVSEWFEVSGGRIASITSSFDAGPVRFSMMKI